MPENNIENMSREDKALQDKLDQDLADAQKKSQGFVDAESNKPEEAKPEGEVDGAKGEEDPEPKKVEDPEPKPTDSEDEDDEDDEEDEEDEPSKNPNRDSDGEDDEDDEDPESDKPKTYIPVKQYRDLKKKYNDLKKLSGEQGSQISIDSKVQDYADKHGLDVESVKELVGLMKEGLVSEEDYQAIQLAAEDARLKLEQSHFEKEWNSDAVPTIERMFPGATPEQIQKAREKIDKISHTKWGHDKELGYIIFKKADEIKDIFTSSEPVKGTKTAEVSKPGKGSASESVVSIESLRSSKDFSKLMELPESERQKIVSQMDPNMYWDYGQYVTGLNQGVEINRNGETVRLK